MYDEDEVQPDFAGFRVSHEKKMVSELWEYA